MEDVKFWKNELTKLQEKYALLEKHLSEVEIKYQLALADQGGDNHGEHSRRLFKTVAGLYGKPLYSDITILLDGERTIRGHKLVLSTWFDEWCGTNLNDVDIIDLSDLDSSTAVTMIKWIYTDIFETKDVDAYFLEELLKAAVKYKLDNLNERCQEALVYFVDQTNCRRFYQTADKMSASILKDHCSKFLPQTELKGQEDEEFTHDAISTTVSDDLMVFDENIIPYKCHLCTKRFDEEKKLNFHINWHTRRKPYSCKYCDKSFNRPIGLKEHTRSHTGEKPFQCDICGRSFSVNSSLKNHKRLHDRELQYSCDICGKAFNTNGNLKYHMMSKHTNVYPYKCKLCDKSYNQKSNLKKHILIHTVDKTLPKKNILYECELCKTKLCSKSGLKGHMRIHTGERPYPCQLCNKAFKLSSTLRKHYKSHERLARLAEKEAEKVKRRLKRQAKKEAKIKREARIKEAAKIKEARIEEAKIKKEAEIEESEIKTEAEIEDAKIKEATIEADKIKEVKIEEDEIKKET